MWHQEAEGGYEAIRILDQGLKEETKINLALIDYAMPEMDGLALGSLIRKRTEWNDVKLIMLTSIVGVIHQKELAAAGFSGSLSKPFSKEMLRQRICLMVNPSSTKKGDSHIEGSHIQQSSISGRTFLLVDDHALNRKAACMMLTKKGGLVTEVDSGFSALEALRHKNFDMILMDVHMPEMDGYETTRRIRKMHGLPARTPIVALTANALVQDRQKSIMAGMDAHINKPFSMDDIERVFLEQVKKQTGSVDVPEQKGYEQHETEYPGQSHTHAVSFDAANVLLRYEGDLVFATEVVQAYLSELDEQVSLLGDLVSLRDALQARELAHLIKGSSSYVGACEMETLLKALIEGLDQVRWKESETCMTHVRGAAERFQQQTGQWMSQTMSAEGEAL